MTAHSHPIEEPMRVSDVLEKAASTIEPKGAWMQGMFGAYEGSTCWCAVGAVGHVLGVIGSTLAEVWINQNARDALGMDAEDLESFNDDPQRTQAEVVAKLREAAALARERGA